MKIAVVYWSGTGNTQRMAEALAKGAQENNLEVDLFTAHDFKADMVSSYDGFAFGCPSMGVEILEERDFGPMFEEILPKLKGSPLVLFGSYGWGDGQWMRQWEELCVEAGAVLLDEGFICRDTPNSMELEGCRNLAGLFLEM
ncbi:MAG: flavodoxin [Tissierellia bacterium]|jgi:flavodoxin short chain|nr:flavodoxin [Tissierellia bacterium]